LWSVVVGTLAEERLVATACAESLKALAHPVRLRIVAALCDEQQTVIGLSRALAVPQAIVSQQLRILRMAGLVAARRAKGFALYAITKPELRNLISCIERCHGGGKR
jgi:DNA-binding transcriptional ArsR family regulator